FLNKLQNLSSPHITNLRGRGLFIGIELKPEAGGARRFCEALKERGMLCKETHEHVIRIAPPLVISQEEVDWAFDQIQAVLS
ncbi:MAG TPA: aminotransferase class III-fold pyridoxal phosphate-dependent enzyme, partial [Acidobacteriota bacterium]|nr:aminotransferase class III-fold pyridoxal phosphate-dependent enzyme [Acidobacteriota bacterium]